MSIKLPKLVDVDYTKLDFDGIINLTKKIIQNHPDYFSNIDDFTESNAARMTIELVAYIVELLSDRIDWIANELTLPTATQKQSVMNLLKLINYRMKLPTAAHVNVTAYITSYVKPFVIPARYSIIAKSLDGKPIRFELLKKDENNKYIYEGVNADYEFDTGIEAIPILSHNDLTFYEGVSNREYFIMSGDNNEFVELSNKNVEEGSIRAYKISRDAAGNITSRVELKEVISFISPEAQDASSMNLPPFKIQTTEDNGVYLVFGERPVVATFTPGANEEIMVWYRTTIGSLGNITRNSINYTTNILAQGRSTQITFINPSGATGGSDSESVEHAKRYGPLTVTTTNKTVNPDDFIILLQNYGPIINSIVYGKSNEPNEIKSEYGYNIPPFEVWIYCLFNKLGIKELPTYSYQKELQITRPYIVYGLVDKEVVTFKDDIAYLKFLRKNSYNKTYKNIIVSDFFNKTQYTPREDFVINLETEQIIRLPGGNIERNGVVVVQYYENEDVFDGVVINFSKGERQKIKHTPIFPGIETYAYRIDLQKKLLENNLSKNDYNYPNNDYYIDYKNGEIVKNNSYPSIESKVSLSYESEFVDGVNNNFILYLKGLNDKRLNIEHDLYISCFRGWCRIGSGGVVALSPGDYYFKISVDGGDYEEFKITVSGALTPRKLVSHLMNDTFSVTQPTKRLTDLPIDIFTDIWNFPVNSPVVTIMSKTKGINSSVSITNGTSGTSLLLYELSNITTGIGQKIKPLDLSYKIREYLNILGVNNGFIGQILNTDVVEYPEVISKLDIKNPTTFDFPTDKNKIILKIFGTNLGTYDGEHELTFSLTENNITGRPAGPYNLTTYQGRVDLTQALQETIDNTIGQDVVRVFVSDSGFRVGFRLVNYSLNTKPYISIKDPTSNSCRELLQFSQDQSSKDGNILEAKISPKSDMINTYFIVLELRGAYGENSLIQIKSNNSIHNNTLRTLGFGQNQKSTGSSLLIRTLPGEKDLVDDGGLIYKFFNTQPNKNNILSLNIENPPPPFDSGVYKILIPPGDYNINQLVDALNLALVSSELNSQTLDISGFIKFEKQEGAQRIRILMTDFNRSSTGSPDLVVLAENEEEKLCLDKLGFFENQRMSTYSTIILHYAGNWITDKKNDSSEETSVIKYLSDKRLITQEYIIKDPKLTSFDLKGTIYINKGFDRNIILKNVKEKIRKEFSIFNREFASPVAITNITKLIEETEGTVYTKIQYFGKNYNKYRQHIEQPKTAIIKGYKPAESSVKRWSNKSAFKLTLDGTSYGGVNYDGEYLVVVGNNWTNHSYDSLLNSIQNGDGVVGGLRNALPIGITGKTITNLNNALRVYHNSGVFTFESVNEGKGVRIKIDNPDDVLINGYQNFIRSNDVIESEYTKNAVYSIIISLNGQPAVEYTITSPSSGAWKLSDISSSLNSVFPINMRAGIDNNGKVRVISTQGGNQSTIDIYNGDTSGGKIDLLPLLGGVEPPVDGSHGYISCLDTNVYGSLYIKPTDAYGKDSIPSITDNEEAFNYRDEIPAKYNEILYISDDYYLNNVIDIDSQIHGIILDAIELGRS